MMLVWALDTEEDFATLEDASGMDDSLDSWASDMHDVRVKVRPDGSVHLFHKQSYMGALDHLKKSHKLVDLPLMPAHEGSDCS